MQRILFVATILLSFAVLLPASFAMNCVAFTKAATGMHLSGDAWEWWDAAYGTYQRGHSPRPGAVMVFRRTRKMPSGHVAVIRAVRGNREVLVDQANWETGYRRGTIQHAVSVIDVSAANDWSEVRVEWARTGNYGRVNPISGFIYASGADQAQAYYEPAVEYRTVHSRTRRVERVADHRRHAAPDYRHEAVARSRKTTVRVRTASTRGKVVELHHRVASAHTRASENHRRVASLHETHRVHGKVAPAHLLTASAHRHKPTVKAASAHGHSHVARNTHHTNAKTAKAHAPSRGDG